MCYDCWSSDVISLMLCMVEFSVQGNVIFHRFLFILSYPGNTVTSMIIRLNLIILFHFIHSAWHHVHVS